MPGTSQGPQQPLSCGRLPEPRPGSSYHALSSCPGQQSPGRSFQLPHQPPLPATPPLSPHPISNTVMFLPPITSPGGCRSTLVPSFCADTANCLHPAMEPAGISSACSFLLASPLANTPSLLPELCCTTGHPKQLNFLLRKKTRACKGRNRLHLCHSTEGQHKVSELPWSSSPALPLEFKGSALTTPFRVYLGQNRREKKNKQTKQEEGKRQLPVIFSFIKVYASLRR